MPDTFSFEGKNRFYFGARAQLIENEREMAADWAIPHIVHNPAHAWVIGRFVEADRANNNKQYFKLGDLQVAQPTITYAPMNINHSWRNIVGAYTASELVYPTGETAGESDEGLNPYIESLGVVWKYYFPDEYRMVQAANAQGKLFFSMEAIPESLSTIGGSDDAAVYAYEGRQSPNYPDEINERSCSGIVLNKPHFTGGALIIPPVNPGWSNADVTQVAQYMDDSFRQAEMANEEPTMAVPNVAAAQQWQAAMDELLYQDYLTEEARTFNSKQRKGAAKSGNALPDGSFPIENVQDLKNAIRAIGRAKDPAAAKAHIKKRASVLGQSALIPDDWK